MNQKIKMVLLVVVLTLGFCLLTTGTDRAANPTGVTLADYLNVRTSAKVDGNNNRLKEDGEYVQLVKGTKVTILEGLTGWYKVSFTYASKTLTGYVSAEYISIDVESSSTPTATPTVVIYKSTTTYQAINVPGKIISKVGVRKKAAGAYFKTKKKKWALSAKKSIKVKGQTLKGKTPWYKIKFKYNGKYYTGYVPTSFVSLTLKTKAPGKIYNVKSIRVRKGMGSQKAYLKVSKKQVRLKKGKAVNIFKEKTIRGKKWYGITFTYKDKTRKAYLLAKYVTLRKKKKIIKVATTKPLTAAEFEAHMKEQKFPESYKPALRKLHQEFPYWQFNAFHTTMNWSTAIKNESKVGLNLISNYKASDWKSKEKGAYDASTGKYVVFDGSTWVTASEKAVKYYMDPRNFLNKLGIYQFEVLDYQSAYQTKDGINSILVNTPFHGKSFSYTSGGKKITLAYNSAFIEAAKKSGVSPYHLAARVRQEVVTSATTTTKAVTGTNDKYPGIYNYYNIGAYHGTDPALNGLLWASGGKNKDTTYMRPWNNRYKALVGGATYLGENYINQGQNTNYLQKFNVTAKKTYWHQFMANVEAASSEAQNSKKAYASSMDNMPILFSIPVYDGMPDKACAMPSNE